MLRKSLYIALVVLCAVFMSGCTNSAKVEEEYRQFISQADQSYAQRDYSEALKNYTYASDKLPSKPEGYEGVVKVLLDKNMYTKAEEVVVNASKRIDAKSSAILYILLGDKYYSIDDYVSAEKAYKSAYSKDNANTRASLMNAKVNLKLGNIDEAKKYLLTEDTTTTEYYELGYIRLLTDWNSIDALNRDIEPLVQSNVVSDINDYVSSFNSTLSVINDNKDDSVYVSALLAREYLYSGYPQLAKKIMELQKDKIVEYWDGLYFLGYAYLETGDTDKAIETLNSILSLGVENCEIYRLLGRAYAIKSDLTQMEPMYDKAFLYVKDEDKSGLYKEYYEILMEKGLYNSAVNLLRKAETSEDKVWINLSYIGVYYAQGTIEKVETHLNELSSVGNMSSRDMKKYLMYACQYYFNVDNSEKIESILTQFNNVDSADPWLQYYYGLYYYNKSDEENAKKYLENAIEYDLQGDASENAKKLLARIK